MTIHRILCSTKLNGMIRIETVKEPASSNHWDHGILTFELHFVPGNVLEATYLLASPLFA